MIRGSASDKRRAAESRGAESSLLNQMVDNGGTLGVTCIQPFS